MKYDLKKDIDNGALISLQWHGAPTLVLIDGESTKTEVNTGDVLKVKLDQAKRLLRYSGNWTLEGDVPLEQLEQKPKKVVKKTTSSNSKKSDKAAKAEEKKAEEQEVTVTASDVEKMTEKEQVLEALEKLGEKANAEASLDELKSVLLEKLAA